MSKNKTARLSDVRAGTTLYNVHTFVHAEQKPDASEPELQRVIEPVKVLRIIGNPVVHWFKGVGGKSLFPAYKIPYAIEGRGRDINNLFSVTEGRTFSFAGDLGFGPTHRFNPGIQSSRTFRCRNAARAYHDMLLMLPISEQEADYGLSKFAAFYDYENFYDET